MIGYKLDVNHILITDQTGEYNLNDGHVIGISLEITSDSIDFNLKYGLNEGPNKVNLAVADGARSYGGFQANGLPCFYKGTLRWAFTTNNGPRALLIITRLSTEPIKFE